MMNLEANTQAITFSMTEKSTAGTVGAERRGKRRKGEGVKGRRGELHLFTSSPLHLFTSSSHQGVAVTLVMTLCALLFSASAFAQKSVKPTTVPPRLLSDLKSPDAAKRREAANELCYLRAKEAVPPLSLALSDRDETVREAAAFALGQITDPRAVPALIKATADKDSEVRATAVFALGMIGERKSASTIADRLEDGSAIVRSAAVTALGLMEDDAAVDELVDALNDVSYDVRYDTVWALGQIGAEDAIEHLQVAMVNIDSLTQDQRLREEFRLSVQTAIEKIRAQEIGVATRPRKTTEGAIYPNRYANESNPIGIRQAVKLLASERARNGRLSGTVKLKVLVAADGRAARAYILKRAGNGLDQRALQAVMQYKFEPTLIAGMPQTGWIFLDIKF
jgi:TonB family protein